ncbi:possible ABC transporter involved in polysaccharide efflux [Synechococcus sp. CC9902]|jgi:capsular polysaccharide transport system permease protein|uniref:ABC transporter permease n=1 Tax=Synechococcus sp. (strain CC9902) TaxID=316279 RepID=UPI00005D3F06|nr:ABC transporter permease [Synechococcus sp. CC9902]ABB25599.1 possible ABC transporter involved in polysaccharide efflux [Synechococcus sp. CC9902]
MNLIKRIIYGLRRQWIVINSVAVYDRNRQAAGSSLGAWENLIGPAQMMAFFILMRVGFSFLRGNNRFAAGGSTDMYFNIVVFMSTGFCIAFLFRNVAIKSLSGLKLRAPLYYSRIKPLDILLALSLNDMRALATLSLAILGLVYYFTWSFQLDSPGLAISVYLLTVMMALGFGLSVVFLGKLNKWILKIIKRLIQRVIIFTSGIFFATFEIPAHIRPFVTWNPILHGVELFRYSINNEYPIPDISLSYLMLCSILMLSFSLILYRTNESLLLESNDD